MLSSAAVKLVALQRCGRKYFLIKTANASIFSTSNRKYKFFLATSRTPNFGPSRKPVQIHTSTYD